MKTLNQNRHILGFCPGLFTTACVVISVVNVLANPLSHLPQLPESGWPLHQETFDEAGELYPYAATNAHATLGNFAFDESWSGHALQRSGASVTPFFVPALGSGQTNISCNDGTIRWWFEPTTWSSVTQPNGAGPRAVATLLELDAVGKSESANVWSLQISADGRTLSLVAQNDDKPTLLLQTEINWQANQSHFIALDYSPKETALFIDGQLVAQGAGTISVPPQLAVLFVGSSLAGKSVAGGDFDELCCFGVPPVIRFNRPLTASDLLFYCNVYAPQAALGPISTGEIAAQEKRMAAFKAQRGAALGASSLQGGGMEAMGARGTYGPLSPSDCVTNVQVYMTNVWAGFDTAGTMTVTFDIVGGTNGLIYDVFGTTNLAATSITNMPWVWLTNSPTCSTVVLPGQNLAQNFYILGTPQDTDGDGLTDAYERLVSHTDPNTFNILSSDGYGTPDAWYLQHSLNPLISGVGSQDPDHDGLQHYQEYLYGSNPQVSEGLNVWVSTPSIFVNVP